MDLEIIQQFIENPELASTLIQEAKPLIYAVWKQVLEIYNDLINNEELPEIEATARYKKYTALCRRGFTQSQAMDILLADIGAFNNSIAKASGVIKANN